eukprot:6684513-Prymnesium_polylepis.2
MFGNLGKQVKRHLESCGVKCATLKEVQQFFEKSWHDMESGTITLADKRRPGKVNSAAWAHVANFEAAVQRQLDRHAEAGCIEYEAHMPADEIWLAAVVNKGGTAVKMTTSSSSACSAPTRGATACSWASSRTPTTRTRTSSAAGRACTGR